MPTRLADGLGPESDLDDGSPSPFAPPRIAPGLGPPRWPAGRQALLGCYEMSVRPRRKSVNESPCKTLNMRRMLFLPFPEDN
jgi:hypothetical protein